MGFYFLAPSAIKNLVNEEIRSYRSTYFTDMKSAWTHLERAHIIGQPYPFQHTRVHWEMFVFGLRTKNLKEIVGQLPRLLTGGVKSFVGVIPVGNTGGANVPPLRSMPIPEDIRQLVTNALELEKA